jgi:hypothetical protein
MNNVESVLTYEYKRIAPEETIRKRICNEV